MKNKPKFIHLQTGIGHKIDNFNELDRDFVTWSTDKIYSDDLQFISVDFILARIKELESEKFDTTTKHGVHNFNTTSAAINELKNLIK